MADMNATRFALVLAGPCKKVALPTPKLATGEPPARPLPFPKWHVDTHEIAP